MSDGDLTDQILDIAYECFVSTSYSSTSMSLIALRLGCSKGTLYNYFESKKELFEAVVRRACSRLQLQLDAAIRHADPRERLVQISHALLNHLLSPEAMSIHRLVLREGVRFPELARLFYEAGPRAGFARIAEALKTLVAQGVLRPCSGKTAAHQLRDLTLAGALDLRLWGLIEDLGPAERRAHAERAVDTFLRAYAPRDEAVPCPA